MKQTSTWADEMDEVALIETKKHFKRSAKPKKASNSEWAYLDRGEAKKPKLVFRESGERVSLVRELFRYIMEARYGELGVQMAKRKTPREAVLVMEDYRAGRPTEGTARHEALARMLKNEEAAMKDYVAKKVGKE